MLVTLEWKEKIKEYVKCYMTKRSNNLLLLNIISNLEEVISHKQSTANCNSVTT